ncbi:hypothetical protein [Variovorax sp. DT-64]|uniref:hypothetical protein n=1 Tax=Variovorax sp. DT-64 TaxID=3396160 RepID=UPI003F1C7CF9
MKPLYLCRRVISIAALTLGGCASAPQREVEWIDPALGQDSKILRGEKVLIACDAYDAAIRQICQDRLFRNLSDRGASPIVVPAGVMLLNDRELDGQLVESARVAGAKALFVLSLAPASTDAGSGLSIGIGGFSFGRNSASGIGLSAPIATGRANTGFAANGRVTDARSGRLVWTATFVAAPSADLGAQFENLSRAMLEAAQRAGLL